MPIDDPNVVLPLAISYNERGVAGYTHTVTNGEDQRKVNCLYEVAKNSLTGKGTLTLSKRQGVTVSSSISFDSVSLSAAYLILNLNNPSDPTRNTLIYKNGDDSSSLANNTGSSRVILSNAAYVPAYCDLTSISNVVNAVVQLVPTTFANGAQRVFFATAANVFAGNAWTEITDGDFNFTHIGKMEHLDGFALIMTSTNLIINSDSNSLANWTASSFIAKQMRQDSAMGLARLSNKVIAFGGETAEVFYNNGNTVGSPLGRITQLHTRVGLVQTNPNGGTHYYCVISNMLYFVGRYAIGGICGLFVFDGSSFTKVSQPHIDKILTEKSSSIYSVSAIVINGQTMVSICFTAPGVSPQISLIFSTDWKEWFEWNSTVFSPVNQGQYYLGLGANSNKIYSFNASDNWQDAGTSYQWLTQFRLPTNGSSLKRMVFYGVDADTDTSASTISVDVSDDDCQSFKSLQPIDLTWERKINFRGGSYTRRHIRLSATDARPKRIANFIANVLD